MRRSKAPTPKQADKFQRDGAKLLEAMVERLGGSKSDKTYKFVVPTTLGPLFLSPYGTWFACRFQDVDKACERLNPSRRIGGVSRLNPYSGKWNFHASWGTKGSETWANILVVLETMEREIAQLQEA